MKKTKIYVGIAAVVAVAFLWYVFSMAANNSNACLTKDAKDIDVGGDANVVMHIHPILTIMINEEQIIIPAGVGLDDGIMRPLHIHDGSGKIHVESACVRDYTIKEFFDVWGQTLNESCILSYCEDETHTLTMYVNGVESTAYGDLVLVDHDEIKIIYEEVGAGA